MKGRGGTSPACSCLVSPYIVVFLVILLIPVILGVVYFRRKSATSVEKNGTPVTLDRNPEQPKMPGATS